MVSAPESGEDPVERNVERIDEPAKLLRIGAMASQLLAELRQAPLDHASRVRLCAIYRTSLQELSSGVSQDLEAEIGRMMPAFNDGEAPSESELRVAQAQLSGWLEGLFEGMRAVIAGQQQDAERANQTLKAPGLATEVAGGLYL